MGSIILKVGGGSLYSNLSLINWAIFVYEYNDMRLLQFLVYKFQQGRSCWALERLAVTNYEESFERVVSNFLNLE